MVIVQFPVKECVMCMCGNLYCDMDQEASRWANERHNELEKDPKWVKKYPADEERERAIYHFVLAEVKKKFGYQSRYPLPL